MTEFELKALQNVQMQIMDDIHRVCLENSLRYYLIGGSAIGAVRHNGIIPWDIDVDIAMPRKDYESFIKIAPLYLNPRYELHDYRTDKDFGTYHALVVLKESTLIFKSEVGSNKKNRFGIFVDVLPLDQWPEDERLMKKQIRKHNRLKLIRYYWHEEASRTGSLPKRIGKRVLSKVLHAFVSLYTLNKYEQKIIMEYNTPDEGTLWCSKLSHYSMERLTMPKTVFGTPKLHDFSGRQYYVPEDVTAYLTHLFGDYMKIPSIEKQKGQINSVYYARWKDDKGMETIIDCSKEQL